MRAYLIDEISPENLEKSRDFLKETAIQSSMESVFWVRVPEDLLSESQFEHRDCRPHVFAIELGQDWIRLEFFVRSSKNMRCTCPGYCTRQQREFVINFAHSMIEDIGMRT